MSLFKVGDRIQYDSWPDNSATILSIDEFDSVLLEFDSPEKHFHDAAGHGKANCCWFSHTRHCTHLNKDRELEAKHAKVISKIKYLDKKFKERKQSEEWLDELFA